jgi:hypothetical protein
VETPQAPVRSPLNMSPPIAPLMRITLQIHQHPIHKLLSLNFRQADQPVLSIPPRPGNASETWHERQIIFQHSFVIL